MTPLIEEKVKEFTSKFFCYLMNNEKVGSHIGAEKDAGDFLRQALIEVAEAQKQSDVKTIKKMSIEELHCEMHVPCMKCVFIVLDEAIKKIQV